MQMTKPVVEGPLGSPPFEKFSINKGISNFVMYKYSKLPAKVYKSFQTFIEFVTLKDHQCLQECQKMYDLAKMFLHCLNHWKLENPTTWRQHYPQGDWGLYRMNYTR